MDCENGLLHQHLIYYEDRHKVKYLLAYPQMGHQKRYDSLDYESRSSAIKYVAENHPDIIPIGRESVKWNDKYSPTRNSKVGYLFGDLDFWKEIEKLY